MAWRLRQHLALLVTLATSGWAWGEPTMTRELASRLAHLPLQALRREYPNKLDHVMNGPAEVLAPRALHPAFYGSYDWHSCVHGHWMLVRLLRRYPDLPEAAAIQALLEENLSAANVAAEVAYLQQPGRQSFERPYGWAWLLKLQEELLAARSPLAAHLQPLANAFAERNAAFFPKQAYPIRSGVHSDTAFGLTFALDYARAVADRRLEAVLTERARAYYGADQNYPAAWEPGGDHFLSPCLGEADLMRRVLSPAEFAAWWDRYLPSLPEALLQPAIVLDRSDPKLVHLDGLNLSRAWAMQGIARSLPPGHPAVEPLRRAAGRHLEAGLAQVTSGDYVGEHWLASFAVYALTEDR